MDYLLRAEQSYRDHYDRAAAVNRDGWKRVRPTHRRQEMAAMRVSVATALVQLAARLAPADPQIPPQDVVPT